MTDEFNFSDLPFFWLLATVVIWAALGAIGYFVSARKIKWPPLVFIARYGFCFFLFFLLESLLLSFLPGFHNTMRNVTATLVGYILNVSSASHSVSDSIITMQNPYLAFDVTVSCLGGLLLWAYTALVLAEPKASVKQRIWGIIVGFTILLAFNLFRIVLSIYLEWLTSVRVHDYFYLFNMVFVLLVWAGWVRAIRPKKEVLPKARV
jgi:exosortase/archaeosortase family protein